MLTAMDKRTVAALKAKRAAIVARWAVLDLHTPPQATDFRALKRMWRLTSAIDEALQNIEGIR